MTRVLEDYSISKSLVGRATLVDLLRDFQIGAPDILKQFGELWAHGGVVVKQKPRKHCLVDRNHLLQIGSMEVHDMPAAKF
jgi:hypothetical protein